MGGKVESKCFVMQCFKDIANMGMREELKCHVINTELFKLRDFLNHGRLAE